MILLPLFVVASTTAAVAIPYIFTQIRDATKQRRKGIIADLDRGFHLKTHLDDTTIASFEFVKYKYFTDDENKQQNKNPENVSDYKGTDFSSFEWLVGSIPLICILCVLNLFFMIALAHQAFKIDFDLGVEWLGPSATIPTFAWVVLTAYAGGMLFMLRSFNQAINNFDFSPLSLVGAAINLIFGLALALLMTFVILRLDMTAAETTIPSFPLQILTAFLAGYVPDVALRTVIRLGHLQFYKSEQADLYDTFKAVPVEIIDGIDSDIRTRLADYHINSVQNLATANPLMLFVETPYGVYEIMDWVAQAQLCASIGPEMLLNFWKLGIRTIFDLERIVFDDACRDEALLREIGAILWRDQVRNKVIADARTAAGLGSSPFTTTILADLRFRLENPHVLRLRQIFNRVSMTLGPDAKSLESLWTDRQTASPHPGQKRLRPRHCRWPKGPLPLRF